MLMILPPSESKLRSPERGSPVALDALSFPAITAVRMRVLEALISTSARPDAFTRLLVRPSMADRVADNTRLLELPARPVLDLYTGPLHRGLDAASLSPAAARRAAVQVIVTSALWGALRPVDRIPSYRLHVCAHLVGMGRLEPTWRDVLPQVLAHAAAEGVVLDLRSSAYQAMGMPAGARDRLVTLLVEHGRGRGARIGDVIAKRVRGEAARLLLESGAHCEDPRDLAMVLSDRWPVQLGAPSRAATNWTMTLAA